MFQDNTLCQPKSEARTLKLLGGKEWLHYPITDGRRNSVPPIINSEDDSRHSVPARGTCAKCNLPVRRRGLNRIANQISKRLAKFAGKAMDGGERTLYVIDTNLLAFGLLQTEKERTESDRESPAARRFAFRGGTKGPAL